MQAILLYFWHLCLLRESPERIPSSLSIAIFATLFYLVIGMVSFAVNRTGLDLPTTFAVSLVSILIEGAALYGLLLFKQYRNRFLSTLIAIFACNGILLSLLLPINLFVKDMDDGLMLDIINTLSLLSLFWWLAIVGSLLRKAAGISIIQGVMLAFVIELIVALSIRGMFDQIS